MLRICLSLFLIGTLFLPPGICVCAANTAHVKEQSDSSSSRDDDQSPDSHEDHLPDCPALESRQQLTQSEVEPQWFGPVHHATHCLWDPIRASNFSFAYPSAAENKFAATPLHILKRVLLV
jgi:hypothetical protein